MIAFLSLFCRRQTMSESRLVANSREWTGAGVKMRLMRNHITLYSTLVPVRLALILINVNGTV